MEEMGVGVGEAGDGINLTETQHYNMRIEYRIHSILG